MATEKFSNSASTTLNGSILSTDLTLVVASASGFPNQGQFRILIGNEVLLVTGVSGTTFTVVRGQEGTLAQSHNHGVTITHILTAGALNQLKGDINRAKMVFIPLVSGPQSVSTTGYTVVGVTAPIPWADLGVGATIVDNLAFVLNIPNGSSAQVQLYDVTNHTSIYTSSVISGPETNYTIQTAVTLTPNSALELWVSAPSTAGGPVTCMSGTIVEVYN